MGMVFGVFAAIGALVMGVILAAIIAVIVRRNSKGSSVTPFIDAARYTIPGSFIVLFTILLQSFSGESLFRKRPDLPPLREPVYTPGPYTRELATGEKWEEGFQNEYGLPVEAVGYYRNGEKAYERTYRMTGIKKRTRENFDQHVIDEWREWYVSGLLRSERISIDKESLRYNFVWWYESGQKKMEAQQLNDMPVGVKRYWSDTGVLLCEMTFNEKGRGVSENSWYPGGIQEFRSGPRYAKNGWEGEWWDRQGNPKNGSPIKTSCDSIPKFRKLRKSDLE